MRQRDREDFIARMAAQNIPIRVSRQLLRYGATLCRLAEAQCNGDWPCDNGERKVIPCPECECGYVPSTVKRGKCPECRVQERARILCTEYDLVPHFEGDPRGAVLIIQTPSGEYNDWGRKGLVAG